VGCGAAVCGIADPGRQRPTVIARRMAPRQSRAAKTMLAAPVLPRRKRGSQRRGASGTVNARDG